MNAQEILDVVEAISNEKRLPVDVVFSAVENALGEATRRHYEDKKGVLMDVRIEMDRTTGEYATRRVWRVVPDDIPLTAPDGSDEQVLSREERRERGYVEHRFGIDPNKPPEVYVPELHLLLKEAQKKDKSLEVGDLYSVESENVAMDRVAVQLARQVIFRQVRDAERAQVLDEYSDRVGELLNGTIDRVTRDGYIVLLKDKVESLLPHNELSGDERFRSGESLRAILKNIDTETRGMRPQLVLSRSDDKMLLELFKLEVPEVSEHIIEILSVAREPGSRSKIAVKTNDGRIDPVGVCVGMRGARVSAVTNQLNGERVDIILWDDNLYKMVSNALSPAKIESVLRDGNKKLLEVVVAPENLAPAVGMRGENVRLASKLMNWEIKIISIDEAKERKREIGARVATSLSEELGVASDVGMALVAGGVESLDAIFAETPEGLQKLTGISVDAANDVLAKAGQLLMVRAIGNEGEAHDLDEQLLALEGMNKEMADALYEQGVKTVEDLAEQSVDELLSIVDMQEKDAEVLILEARKPWLEGLS